MPTRTAIARLLALLVPAALLATVAAATPAAALPTTAPAAALAAPEPPGFTFQDPEITESSGLVASGRHPDVYWTHNDSSTDGRPLPYLYAVDGKTGETLATITLEGEGAVARDIEAIALGPDGALYLADIGDNFDGEWEEVYIYRLNEPEDLKDGTVYPTVYRVQYDDGPRDAEALMVHPKTGLMYIVSKMQDGGAAIYAGPDTGLSQDKVNTFERFADIDLWVTDGAFSPDGTRLFLRGYFTSQMYVWEDGSLPEPIEREVRMPAQRQGEAVTFTTDGTMLLFGSEGEGSDVEAVRLEGDLRPEDVQAAAESGGDGAGGTGASSEEDGGGLDRGTLLLIGVGVLVVVAVRRVLANRKNAAG